MPAGDGKDRGPRWRHEDLPYDAIDRAAVRDDRLIFYMLATASFVEITTDLYTRNLIDYFKGDPEVQDWLAAGWEPEELQHGAALRRYVNAAWPDFDWERSYRAFLEEYSGYCQVELLGPTRALEMARRCIVETGTCSYYTMIGRLSPCPVLTQLADNIRRDEAGHYAHFHLYFRRYCEDEHPSRLATLKALVGRIREIEGEDGYIAFKHVWLTAIPNRPFRDRDYKNFVGAVRKVAVEHYPFRMAAHMASKPLGFSPKAQRRTETVVAAAARFAARTTGSLQRFQ